MKRIYIPVMLSLLSSILFSSCAKKIDEPYYDRAQNASQKAHTQLRKD